MRRYRVDFKKRIKGENYDNKEKKDESATCEDMKYYIFLYYS
jgi:hypothetical protein